MRDAAAPADGGVKAEARGTADDRRTTVALLAIGAAAVVVRLAYVVVVASHHGPLHGDAETYHLLARALAGGHGYVRPRELADPGVVVPTAEFPPLWPAVLALADVLGLDRPGAQRLVGAVLGGVTVVAIGAIGRQIAGARAAIVAAALAAVYPQFVVIDGSLLAETLATLLVTLAVLAAVRVLGGDRRAVVMAAAGGAVGLAALTRSETVLLVPGLLLPLALVARSPRRLASRLALVLVPPLVLVGSWTVRNAVRLDAVVPLSTNSGSLLAGANCPATYAGPALGQWRLDCIPRPDYRDGEAPVAARLRADGLRYARHHVDRLPVVLSVRLLRTFGAWDVRAQNYYESLDGRPYRWVWAGWFGYVAVAVLAVVGAVRLGSSWSRAWPLVAPVALAVVTALLAYGNQRFRVLAEPALIVLAAIAVSGIAVGGRRRRLPDPGGLPDAGGLPEPASAQG